MTLRAKRLFKMMKSLHKVRVIINAVTVVALVCALVLNIKELYWSLVVSITANTAYIVVKDEYENESDSYSS